MSNLSPLMSSVRHDWETPPALFQEWNDRFRFTLDVCATPETAKVWAYFTPEQDGLAQPWAPNVCWMNPPYGRAIRRWVEKAHAESLRGARVVGLLPARTDAGWWHEHVIGSGAYVKFLRGRIRFVGAPHNAPFPSAIVVW